MCSSLTYAPEQEIGKRQLAALLGVCECISITFIHQFQSIMYGRVRPYLVSQWSMEAIIYRRLRVRKPHWVSSGLC